MARLLPDFISEECKSNAERRLFARFRDELPGDVTVLHSLGVAKHRYKPYAEADFVLIHEKGVLVFEVKGGRVARREGAWFFTDRYGQIHKRRESPMQQAASVAAALRESVLKKFGKDSPQARAVFGSVTFFPDIEFAETSPEWDLRRVYDHSAWQRPIAEIVSNALQYSCCEVTRVTRHEPAVLNSEQRMALVQFLRGDFEKIPSLNVVIADHEQQMIDLAAQQYAVLDRLSRNPRMIIEGSAGTGKTLLALECARRHALQGRRVLFVCFNRLLAEHLNEYAALNKFLGNIAIATLHAHLLAVIRAAGLKLDDSVERQQLFQNEIPEAIPGAVPKIQGFSPWDVIVVDEGQDIAAHPPFAEALSHLLKGGFSKGRWIWFEDPRQRILRQSNSCLFELAQFNPSYYQLTRNWRNTNEVATFTCVATMTPLPELSGIAGDKVKTVVCDGKQDLMKLQLLVTDLLLNGARSEHIVLLTANAQEKAMFANAGAIAGLKLVRYESGQTAPTALRYSSVFQFKGLESKIIIITDLDDLQSEIGRMAAYVGMSRANSALFLLISKNAQGHLEENRLNFADATAS